MRFGGQWMAASFSITLLRGTVPQLRETHDRVPAISHHEVVPDHAFTRPRSSTAPVRDSCMDGSSNSLSLM
jgi:hypothetical protein